VIVTQIEHLPEQINMTPGMQKAVEFLRLSRTQDLEDGEVELDGRTVYAVIQTYDTLPGAADKYEGHRKYIDIQYVAAGEEVIGWAYIDRVTITVPYVEKDDYWLGTVPADEATPTRLAAGQVAVLYPTDAHAPRRAAGAAGPVKKIVVKVAVGA
jgi:YhcH/YjgK/YiaL family protein